MAHGLSCSAACGIFPDQGSNPVSPALAGGFLTTVPPGKPQIPVLEVRSQCSCKPPPKQMLFSVLTRKGKVPRLSFHPLRPRPWLRGGPWAGQLPCMGAFIQHLVWVFPIVPRPDQWAAMERALELCRTQPSACPQDPQLTCQS